MIASAETLEMLRNSCQALSQELTLEPLIDQVTISAVQIASASRSVIILFQEDETWITLEAIKCDRVMEVVTPCIQTIGRRLPVSMLNEAKKSLRPIALGNCLEQHPRESDPYFAAAGINSAVCIPLVAMQRHLGFVYLEDGHPAQTVTEQQLMMLELLASHAAMCIANAVLTLNVEQAEQDARQARNEWRQEFDLIPVQIWRTDDKGVLEAANQHWHEFTGMTHEDASSEAQQYRNTCHPDDKEKVFGLFARLQESGLPGEVECRMLRSDGEYRRVLARAAPLHDEHGNIIKWHGTNIDIEEVKRAEDAQEALARISRVTALGELAVSIAHEVNQPLMSIVTNAAACLRWLASDSPNHLEARKAAERIVRDGHRAGDVIASIRELSRKAPPKLVELDINDVVSEVLALTRNELDRHGIAVKTQLSKQRCMTLADRVQIQQVVLNLIVNGIEAMDRESASSRILTVSTEDTDRHSVVVCISDTGRGLELENPEQIFDAFFTSKVGGIGMGLSICRSIIENYGGKILVSENKPRGCTFSFRLPACEQGYLHACVD